MGSSVSTGKVVTNVAQPAANKVRYTDFPLHARALPVVLMMELHGVEYEANPVTKEDWPALKETGECPFGALPIMQTSDCGTIAQQAAILKYIATTKECGPKDLKEEVRINMAIALSNEILQKLDSVQPSIANRDKPKDKCDEFWAAFPSQVKNIEAVLEADRVAESGSSIADIHLFGTLHEVKNVKPDVFDGSEKVKKFYDRINALEPVTNVLEGKSSFGGFYRYFLTQEEAAAEAAAAPAAEAAAPSAETPADAAPPAEAPATDAPAAEAGEKKVRLTYFPLKGGVMPIVVALEVHGIAWEVRKVEFADWPTFKASGDLPFGQLPILETEDAGMIAHVSAIMSYITEKSEAAGGKDLREKTLSKMIHEGVRDILSAMRDSQPTVFNKTTDKAVYDKFWDETLPTKLGCLEKMLDGKAKYTESGTSVGELALFTCLEVARSLNDKCLDASPNLKTFYERIEGIEAVKNVYAGKSPFGELVNAFVKREETPATDAAPEAKPAEVEAEKPAEATPAETPAPEAVA